VSRLKSVDFPTFVRPTIATTGFAINPAPFLRQNTTPGIQGLLNGNPLNAI
jgi:hypothetical protein